MEDGSIVVLNVNIVDQIESYTRIAKRQKDSRHMMISSVHLTGVHLTRRKNNLPAPAVNSGNIKCETGFLKGNEARGQDEKTKEVKMISKKNFPRELFVKISEDGEDKYFVADKDSEFAEDGEFVAIYDLQEIRRKKVTVTETLI
jgi:hypothetical protein